MKLVSPLLKRVVYPGLARTGYLRRFARNGPAVVTYHGVLPKDYRAIDPMLDGSLVNASSLRLQIRLLQRNYQIISPEQFREWLEGKRELPPRAVLLTCDDGLQNTLSDMLPVLHECGVSCLFFVTGASTEDTSSMLWYEELYLMFLSTGDSFAFELRDMALTVEVNRSRSKRNLWWELVKRLSRYDQDTRRGTLEKVRMGLGLSESWKSKYVGDSSGARRFGLLTGQQLRELLAGEMSIGAHTLSHPMLSLTTDEVAREEIAQSRTRLERLLGRPVWALAYPFGDPGSVTAREVHMAEEAGFSCAFTNVAGGFGAETPRFAIPRVHVTAEMSLPEFEAHVSGFYRSLRWRLAGPEQTIGIPAHAQGVGNGCR